MFGSAYNKAINNILFTGDGFAGANTYETGHSHAVQESLDGLFLRTPDLIIPPNTNVRIHLTASSANGLYKSIRGDNADTNASITANDIWFNAHFITKSVPVPDMVQLKFVTPDSFKSTITGASHNVQYTMRERIIRVSAFMISATATTTTITTKAYNIPNFTYVTDGDTEAQQLDTLVFKVGSQQIPQSPFDNTTYRAYESYRQIMEMCEHSLDQTGGELYSEWAAQGKYYSVPVVKSANDTQKNVECMATFKAQPTTTNLYVTGHYENFVTLTYQNGVPVDTRSLI